MSNHEHYEDYELLKYIDGQSEYAEEIEQCDFCYQQAKKLEKFQNRIKGLLKNGR